LSPRHQAFIDAPEALNPRVARTNNFGNSGDFGNFGNLPLNQSLFIRRSQWRD
jgi:hypothetical protein